MAGPVKYLSGRQNKLKIGIPDYNQETTTLQVFGRVGVGTTNATSDLYVKGGGEFTGVVTVGGFFPNRSNKFFVAHQVRQSQTG